MEKCCCCMLKRRSPSSSSLQQPNSKKPTLQPSPSTTPLPVDPHLADGCSTASPVTATPPSSDSEHPVTFRSFSDKIDWPGTEMIYSPSDHSLDTQLPEKGNVGNLAKPTPAGLDSVSASLPPLPPIFRRSVSDLALPACLVTTTTLPPHPSASTPEMHQDRPEKESPNTKRLKRMKDRTREMRRWLDLLTREIEEEEEKEEDCVREDRKQTDLPNYESGSGIEEEEEAVWVERKGECLNVHFKCPCSQGYKILLSGNNCYYKLTQ